MKDIRGIPVYLGHTVAVGRRAGTHSCMVVGEVVDLTEEGTGYGRSKEQLKLRIELDSSHWHNPALEAGRVTSWMDNKHVLVIG